jgi:hypothetical protein
MSSVERKLVLLRELVISGKRKYYVLQDLVNTELVEALVFVFQLKTGGPKLLCAPVCFAIAKTDSDFTNLIFLKSFCGFVKT